MFEGDICRRIIHSGRIAYFKQGRKLFSGERLRFRDHDPSMALFRNWSVVNFAQIGEGLSWGLFSKVNLLVAISRHFFCAAWKIKITKNRSPHEQPLFSKSMPDPPTGRTFHMFEC